MSRAALETIYNKFDESMVPRLRSLLIKFDVAYEIDGDAAAFSNMLQRLGGDSALSLTVIAFGKRSRRDYLGQVRLSVLSQACPWSHLYGPGRWC